MSTTPGPASHLRPPPLLDSSSPRLPFLSISFSSLLLLLLLLLQSPARYGLLILQRRRRLHNLSCNTFNHYCLLSFWGIFNYDGRCKPFTTKQNQNQPPPSPNHTHRAEIMMSQRFLSLSFALLFLQWVSALQVTPNSPCSSACMDNSNADASDPSSSNTRNSDMACEDNNFSGAAAVKWKQCMTCLQNSTFHQGSESDQSWFLCTWPPRPRSHLIDRERERLTTWLRQPEIPV